MKKCKYCDIDHNMRGLACRICKDGLYRYNMSRIDQLKLYEDQNKKCFLCETDIEMFIGHKGGFVDHNHETGKVRGILCNKCNTKVGVIESVDIKKLINYIDKY